MQFVVAAAGSYQLYSDTRKGLTCTVGSYLFGKEKAADRLIDLFFAAEGFYAQLFASPYPFREVNIIEVNDWGFGQAPPGIIFITQEAFEPKTDVMNQFFSKGVNERFVHEIAHAWWGHHVKMDSLEEQWLSESFAEYSAALCIAALAGGGDKGEREFNEILKGWRSRAKEVGRGASVYLANYLAGDDQTDVLDRHYLLYDKGPLVIHGIRRQLWVMYGVEEGDKVFVAFLQGVQINFSYKWAGTRHLVGILNQLTGEDWQPWFELYVYGCETPDLG
jgi:aminopeptidase N